MNLERKAKNADRIGVRVVKRLELVQAGILAKRGEADDISEPGPLLKEEEAWVVCNVYRADKQFNFWSRRNVCPSAMFGRRYHPFQKQEKTAHQRFRRHFGLQQVWFFYIFTV